MIVSPHVACLTLRSSSYGIPDARPVKVKSWQIFRLFGGYVPVVILVIECVTHCCPMDLHYALPNIYAKRSSLGAQIIQCCGYLIEQVGIFAFHGVVSSFPSASIAAMTCFSILLFSSTMLNISAKTVWRVQKLFPPPSCPAGTGKTSFRNTARYSGD